MKTMQPRQQRDPVLSALRRLLAATDRNIAAAGEMRRARVELARLIEPETGEDDGKRQATTDATQCR